MSNCIANKIILPKATYAKYFCDDDQKGYSLKKLCKDASQYSYYIYPDDVPIKDLDETVELYFSTRWRYPIEAILNLFQATTRKNDILWYCCEENYIYVSRFSWNNDWCHVDEDILYLEDDKKFDKFLGDRLDSESESGSGLDWIWDYHPETCPGWQYIDSTNLLERYKEAAMDACDEIRKARIPWVDIKDTDHEKFRICIENYTREEDFTPTTYTWCWLSWGFLQGGHWYEIHRSEDLECGDIDQIRDELNDLISGKLKQSKDLFFIEPFLSIDLIADNNPRIIITMYAQYLRDSKKDLKITLAGKELQRFYRYLKKITSKTQEKKLNYYE